MSPNSRAAAWYTSGVCDDGGSTPLLRMASVCGWLAPALLLLAAGVAGAQSRGCTTLEQNTFVRDVLADLYLWNGSLPRLDPAAFESPEALLAAARSRELDSRFSYITARAESDAYFTSSRYVGLGFSTLARGTDLVISQVYPGSPAADGGLMRGDRIVSANGRSPADFPAVGAVRLVIGRGDDTVHVTLERRPVVIPTVSNTSVLDVDGRRVGYVFVRNFVQPTATALDEAFATLRAADVSELVLDLRYNAGGLVPAARHLAGLAGGTLVNGQVFARYSHNGRNAFRDLTLRFRTPNRALRLTRLFVITTRATASASELVINALRPFMRVIVIGERTSGKPVGQYLVPFCDRVLAPVAFVLRNADGRADYFDGIEPDCQADDDLRSPIGSPHERSLQVALAVVRTGNCGYGADVGSSVRPEVSRAWAESWFQVIGAH